jgi:hypothetical protein
MKNVNLEIKRMLSLVETKIGNVKPLLSEQSENTGQGSTMSPEDVLTRVKETGCLTNKGATSITDIGRWQAKFLPLVSKNNLTPISAGDPYLRFKMKDRDGFGGDFYLFGKRGRGPEGSLCLLKRTGNTVFQQGQEGFEKPHFVEDALRCPEFEIAKSDISQNVKLTADQTQRRDDILKNGAMETGYSYTTEQPTSGVGKRYVAVDLNTGIGTDGKQYIKKVAVDSLKNVFPTPGRFFIWVDLGQEERLRDMPADVEKLLATMGYTREQPPIGSTEEYEATSLKQLCDSTQNCSGGLLDYANSVEGGRRVWPMTAEQKAAAETKFNMKISDYKSFVATSASGRQARRSVKDVQSQYADKDSCRAAITVLHGCMKTEDNKQCADTINATYAKNYKGNENQYFDTLVTLKELVKKCEAQDVKITGAIGGKNYETMRDELRKSTSKFSPYSTTDKRDISLEESLTRNIKSTIKEHTRKNMRSRRYL